VSRRPAAGHGPIAGGQVTGFVGRRVAALPPLLVGISILVFLVIHLVPGDPVAAILGTSANSPELVARLHEQLGLNLPLPVQYLHWMKGVLSGDFGYSYSQQTPVSSLLVSNLADTAQLTVASLLFSLIFGSLVGVLAARRRNTLADTVGMGIALIFLSMPSFWLGLILIIVFAVQLHWFPVVGGLSFHGLILPALTLGLASMGFIARFVRSSVIEAGSQPHVMIARAKGLRRSAVLFRHILRNSVISVLPVIGLELGNLLTGAVIVETVFSRPGLGRLLVTAILSKDYPTVQAVVLLIAVIYAVLNLVVDLLYPVLDPRLRHS
jgi:ABC-type dipeptide/oligopeptide/nickel transport system permease component